MDLKQTYKDGKIEGPWVLYWKNGQLTKKGPYKDGTKDMTGKTSINPAGALWAFDKHEGTGTYRNDKKFSD